MKLLDGSTEAADDRWPWPTTLTLPLGNPSTFSDLVYTGCTVLLLSLLIYFVASHCSRRPRSRRKQQTTAAEDELENNDVRRAPALSLIQWPVLGHIPALGRLPHRALTALSGRHGPVFRLRLGGRRAVVVSGHAAVRGAFSAATCMRRGHQGSVDDRPDFESYRQYAAGRSISFQSYGPGLRVHRRLASAAIRRLVGSGLAEEIVRREADSLVESWLRAVAAAAGAKDAERGVILDPAEGVMRAIEQTIYSMCYGVEERLDADEEYMEVLTAKNPGTELFVIGNQVHSTSSGIPC